VNADSISPMFPLGSVLLPGMLLPLHIFEDRYRRLIEVVLEADEPEFAVTLIERGSEVGGGDIRAMVGCTARVLEAGRTDDGRWAVITVGIQPVQVVEWLPDDPFPRARILPLVPTDDALIEDSGSATSSLGERLERLAVNLRRCVALASELGQSGSVDVELSEDPWLATFQAAALAPLGSLDRQRVLSTRSTVDRLDLVESLLEEQAGLLEGRLRLGGSDDGDLPWDPD